MPYFIYRFLFHFLNSNYYTKKHGIVVFSCFSGWRNTLIYENANTIQDIEPVTFCLIVAKYLISKKENIVYNEEYYRTIKTYNDIKLFLENDELDKFSNEFVSKYKNEISYYISVDGNNKNDNHNIIKIFFLKTKEEFDRIVESTTRFTNLGYDKNTLQQVKKISEAAKNAFTGIPIKEIERIAEAVKIASDVPFKKFKRITEAVNNVSSIPLAEFTNFFKNENEISPPVIHHHYELEALYGIKDLLSSFITTYNYFKEYSKGMLEFTNITINQIRDKQELQIKENDKNSKSANNQSNRAFILSIIAVLVSLLVGLYQMFSVKTTKLNTTIEKLGSEILELNKSNTDYINKIETTDNP
jgi:hypothetical protein